MRVIRTLIENRELLFNLVGRELKSRYRGSIAGFLWTILTPLFMAGIYIFFLRMLLGRGALSYESLLIGVFAWQFTSQCVNAGTDCFVGNANLIKKVVFPRIVLPVSSLLSATVNFLLTLVVQMVLVAVLLGMKGVVISAFAFALPAMILYQALFNLGLILLVATAHVYFRDTQYIVNLAMSAWFFMSPVMYPLSLVERIATHHAWIQFVYMLNPMSVIITGYRALQIPGETFPWSYASVLALLWPMLFLYLSWVLFNRAQRWFSDYL